MKQSTFDNFPGGNLSYSLKIDQDKLNERFSWVLSMFRHFENKMKYFEDKLSMANFQNTINPLLFERSFEKISKEALDKMHAQRTKVYWELYNGLSKDITQKFTAAVLLQQQKRLQQTRVLILANITSSAKAIDRLSDENTRTRQKLTQISKTIQYHQKQLKYPEQKPTPIFISQVSIQTIQQPKQDIIETQSVHHIQTIHTIIQQKVDTKVQQLSQRLQFVSNLLNKKCENILLMVASQDQKLKQFYQDSEDQYSIDKHMLGISNRSMSPSIRKRSQMFQTQSNFQIDIIRQQINLLKQKLSSITQVKSNQFTNLKQRVISIQQTLSRDINDPNQQKWIKEKVANYLEQMFQSPFQQKFGKGLSDTINKKMLDVRFDLVSYMKQIDKKLEQRVSKTDLKNVEKLLEEKIILLQYLIKKKVDIGDVDEKMRRFTTKINFTPEKSSAKTQVKQSSLSQRQTKTQTKRETKTERLLKRPSPNKKLSLKTLSQSFHIASYGKRFF